MMPINIIDAATIYVDFGTQMFNNDRRILNVPGGPPLPHRGVPPFGVAVTIAMPQDEISPVPSVAIVCVSLEPDFLFWPATCIEPVQLAEILVRQRIEKDITPVTGRVAPLHE